MKKLCVTRVHLCVGFLFLVVRSRLLLPPSLPSAPPAGSLSLTHNLLTHTHNLFTHDLLTYNILTQLSHTHTQLNHTEHTHHAQLSHKQRTHTHTQNFLTHNIFTHNLLTHNLALGDIDLHFGRQDTYGTGLALVARSVPVWRGCRRSCLCGRHGAWQHRRRGTYGTGLALVARLVPVAPLSSQLFVWQRGAWQQRPSLCRPAFCVVGVALMALGWLWWRAWFPLAPLSPRLFVWQAWRLATSTFTLCGRRAWQAWHLWHWAGSGGALGSCLYPYLWCWHLGYGYIT